MCLVQHDHAKTALPDAAADAQRQPAGKQLLMEEKVLTLLLSLKVQLPEQCRLVYTDTHGRQFDTAPENGIPDENVAI